MPDETNDEFTPDVDETSEVEDVEEAENKPVEGGAESTEGDSEAPFGGYEAQPSVAVRNQMMLGELVVHYPSRDVRFIVDGDAGMRVLTMFRERQEKGLADRLHAQVSSARAGWVVLDLSEPLAMTWLPGLPRPVPRTAVDPLPAA